MRLADRGQDERRIAGTQTVATSEGKWYPPEQNPEMLTLNPVRARKGGNARRHLITDLIGSLIATRRCRNVRASAMVAIALLGVVAAPTAAAASSRSAKHPRIIITSTAESAGQALLTPVTLSCEISACSGSVQLTGTVNSKKKVGKRTAATVILASVRYKLAKGTSGTFDLKLTKIGRSALAKGSSHPALREKLVALVTGGTTTKQSVVLADGGGSTSTTSVTPSSPSVASIESAICAAAAPSGVSDGDHCGVTDLKVSSVDTNWVYGFVGEYNAQDQPQSDEADVILNLSTHQLIFADDGFCGEGTGAPVAGYSSVPANVLAGFGLGPCSSSTTTTVPSTTTLPPTTTTTLVPAGEFASFVGTWGAHERRLS